MPGKSPPGQGRKAVLAPKPPLSPASPRVTKPAWRQRRRLLRIPHLSRCCNVGQHLIPRASRRRSPEAPAGTGQAPQDHERNALLSQAIPAYPRPTRRHQDRPVTPEVAGSSPVAPVKIPAKWHIVLSVQTPDRGRLHAPSIEATRNSSKRPDTGPGRLDFKPIHAEFTRATTAACDYTKRPEVTAPATRVSTQKSVPSSPWV
jgi:hypothetical protein